MKRIILLTVLLFTLSLNANEASDYPEAFMKGIMAEKYDQTIDNYFSTNPLFTAKTQQILLVKSQVKNMFNIFGKATTYELALTESLSSSLMRFVYIVKHPNHPTVWEFFIYKPKDK